MIWSKEFIENSMEQVDRYMSNMGYTEVPVWDRSYE